MVGPLADDDMRPFAGRQDILQEVHLVDLRSDPSSRISRCLIVEVLEVVEVRRRVLKRRALEQNKTFEVPGLDVRRFGVQVDREVEEVGQDDGSGPPAGIAHHAGLQDVQTLDPGTYWNALPCPQSAG